jgi:hypothetical protein
MKFKNLILYVFFLRLAIFRKMFRVGLKSDKKSDMLCKDLILCMMEMRLILPETRKNCSENRNLFKIIYT